MRRPLVLLPIVAIATASAAALVVSAGPSGAGAGTVGYTIYLPPNVAETDTSAADPATTAVELPPADVGVAQDANCDAQLATIDLASGVATPLSAPPSGTACAGDLAFAPDGTLYGLVQGGTPVDPAAELVTFDLTTGAASVVGTFGPFELSLGGGNELPTGGITFDAQGTLYAELGQPDAPGFDEQCTTDGQEINYCLYRVDDPSNPGASTLVGVSSSGEPTVSTLATSCDTMYTSTFEREDDFSTVHTVDNATGALSEIGALRESRFLEGADFDLAGTFWGLVVEDAEGIPFQLVTLDPAGGTPVDTPAVDVTVDGDDSPFFNALAIQPLDCAQPEPAPIVLAPTFTG